MNKFIIFLNNRKVLVLLSLTILSYIMLLLNNNLFIMDYFIIIPLILSIYFAPYIFIGNNYSNYNGYYLIVYFFIFSTLDKLINTFTFENMMAKIIFNIILAIIFLSIYYVRIKTFRSKE